MISSERAQAVISRVFEGEAVRKICQPGATDRPCSESAFYEFIGHPDNAEFAEQYARAIVVRSEIFAEDIIEISDNAPTDRDSIAKARLQTDSRKWLMSKLAPKKYGDRIQQEVSGPDGNAVQVQFIIPHNGRDNTPAI